MFFRLRNLAVLAVLCAAVVPFGCSQSQPAAAQPQTQTPSKEPVLGPSLPARREADDTARFLAGLPGKEGSPFLELESTDVWKDHRKRMDDAYARAERALLSGLREFQKNELNDPAIAKAATYYPFSGPDVLLITLAFPHSPVYSMAGLEPPGTLPTVERLEKKKMPQYLPATRDTLASVLGRSFFITKQMDAQFRGQVTDGLLLPIMELLVRSNYTILAYRYVRLEDDGKVIDRDSSYQPGVLYANKGIEVEFRSDADQSFHKLHYFTLNLADERLKNNKAYQNYVASLKGFNTAFKATSYMTHHVEFSVIRGLVLDNANLIMQDDSGMPFRYLPTDTWKIQLYGGYTQPFGTFRYWAQKDMAKAYTEPGVKTLPFRIGYGYSVIPSNEQIARRIHPLGVAAPTETAAVATK
jgi:hypothetical protein